MDADEEPARRDYHCEANIGLGMQLQENCATIVNLIKLCGGVVDEVVINELVDAVIKL